MPRFKLILEYDGTPFVGWQRQENGLSVQEVLEGALFAMTGARVTAHGAGRTDAGVHARGQVAHVDLERDWAPFRLSEGLNALVHPHPVAIARRRARGRRFRRAPQRDRSPLSLSHRQSPRAPHLRARLSLAGEAAPRRRGDARGGACADRPSTISPPFAIRNARRIRRSARSTGSTSGARATTFSSRRARAHSCIARCARWWARWSRSAPAAGARATSRRRSRPPTAAAAARSPRLTASISSASTTPSP